MNMHNLRQGLTRLFGEGSKPLLRRALYDRLERIVEEHGERAFHVIATAAADAVGKDRPGNYFAFVVVRRLIDRGILSAPEVELAAAMDGVSAG